MLRTHLIIGEITKPQGVRGELKLRPATCDLSRFDGLTDAFLQEGENYIPVKLNVTRVTEDAVFLYIDGVADRDAAEKLRGKMLCVDREHAVQLDDDTSFICDLYGLKGLTDDGRDLGKIVDVMQPGGNDVYVFKGKLGEVLVPALRSVVAGVDLEAGVMRLVGARLDEVAVFEDED